MLSVAQFPSTESSCARSRQSSLGAAAILGHAGAASGVCGSDIHAAHGQSNAGVLPMVAGHEGSGVVEAVGPGVESVTPGDPVVLGAYGPCYECVACRHGRFVHCTGEARVNAVRGLMPDGTTRVRSEHGAVHPFVGIGSLAEYAVLREAQVVKVPDDVPLHADPVRAVVELAGEEGELVPVAVQVWRVQVGRVPLYLLDTDVDGNPDWARAITDKLYGGRRLGGEAARQYEEEVGGGATHGDVTPRVLARDVEPIGTEAHDPFPLDVGAVHVHRLSVALHTAARHRRGK